MSNAETVADTSTVVRGMLDLLSRSMVGRLTGLVSSILLARLLVPEDFGRAAVAMSIVNVAVFFLDSGMTAAALRLKEEPSADLLRALSGIQLIITVVACLVITPIALLGTSQPALTIAALALLPLMSLQTPMVIGAERRLDFRNISNAELVASLGSQGATVALAFIGAGVWALVVGAILRPLLSAIWLAPTVDRKILVPSLRVDRAFPLLKDALRLQVMPASMVLRDQGSTLIAATAVGTSALGTWVLVGRLLSVSSALYAVLGRVAYPAVAARSRQEQIDVDQVKRAIARISFVSAWLLGMTCAGSIYAVPVVFGEEWSEAVPALLATCIGMLVTTSIATPTISLLMVERRVLGPVLGVGLHAVAAWSFLVWGPLEGSALAIGVAGTVGSLVETATLAFVLHRRGMHWRSTAVVPLPALGVAAAAVSAALGAGQHLPTTISIVAAPLVAAAVLGVGSLTVLRAEWSFVRTQVASRLQRGDPGQGRPSRR